MKHNIKLYLTLLIGLLAVLGTTSCQKDNDIDPYYVEIELSADQLTFDRGVGSQEVEVKVDEGKSWTVTVTPQVEWVNTSQQGDKLIVAATENTTGVERKVTVNIMAGNNTKRIGVTQASADAIINISNDKVSLPACDSETYVEVSTNLSGWTLQTPAEEWLQADALQESKAIKITVTRNPVEKVRQAELKLTFADGSEQIITVEQAGQLRYFVPYNEEHTFLVYKDVINYDQSRGFKMTMFQMGSNDEDNWFSIPTAIEFQTASEVLPRLIYYQPLGFSLIYENVYVTLTDPKEFITKEGGYINYLKEIGYTERYGSTEAEPKLISPDGFLVATYNYDKNSDTHYVIFTAQYLPDEPMPTLDELPEYPSEIWNFFEDPSKKYSEVYEWETAQGSEEVTKVDFGGIIAFGLFKTNQVDDINLQEYRFYSFYHNYIYPRPTEEKLGSVLKVELAYNDYTKIVFDIPENQYKTTPEFEALAAKEGFVFKNIQHDGIHFINEAENMEMVVLKYADEKTFGSEGTATIRYVKLPPKENSETSASDIVESTTACTSVMSVVRQ
ncbi:MAG: BACON domain-containing protein [Porphyromonas sp.]|nr:BACON domain-containing protein [Porphyromonas sp.]